jgi:tetratricopeptide (TPR) repeat protein
LEIIGKSSENLKMRTAWRDCKEWLDEGLPLSTTNNQTCKLYDASLSQYIGWYNDKSMGGLEKTMANMIESDPNFVLGKTLSYGLELMSTSLPLAKEDSEIVIKVKELEKQADQIATLTKRERDHVKALRRWSEGNLAKAAIIWEDILFSHPTDIQAIKMVHDTYFFLGWQTQMRDSVARVLPEWKKDLPLQNYLYGMYAFGLVETNYYDEAEKNALQGLELNQYDGWATHALAHVFEMTGQAKRGISFLDNTVADWEVSEYLACHNYWHLALYHVENKEPEAALEIYEKQILPRASTSGAMLDYVDAAALLYRLELEEVKVGDRWKVLSEIAVAHKDDHTLMFNDAHFLMSMLGSKDVEIVLDFMASLKEFSQKGTGDQQLIAAEVGETLMEAMVAFDKKDYATATDLLAYVKYKIVKIGGSDAQRDIFNILLLNAAIKSNNPHHLELARSLVNERKARKPNSPLTDRIAQKMELKKQIISL